MSASVGGECAQDAGLQKTCDSVVADWFKTATAAVAGKVTMFCWSEQDFANGGTVGVVLFWDVSQQVLFTQQAGAHAFSLGTFEKMHEAAGSCIDVPKSAAAMITEVQILVVITPSCSTIEAARRMPTGRN